MKKRYKTLVWVIDGHSYFRRAVRVTIEEKFKHVKVDPIESIQWAMGLTEPPDIVLIEIPLGDLKVFASFLATFIEQYRSARLGAYALGPNSFKELAELMKMFSPNAVIEEVNALDPKGMVDFVGKFVGGTAC